MGANIGGARLITAKRGQQLRIEDAPFQYMPVFLKKPFEGYYDSKRSRQGSC